MKLPWKKHKEEKQKLETEKQDLQKQIEKLEEQKQKIENQFKAEKQRRRKLSTEKQKAETQLKKLENKIRNQKTSEDEEQDKKQEKPEKISFQKTWKTLKKLETIESSEKDLTTIYSPQKIQDINDSKALKNSINRRQYQKLEGQDSFIAFLDENIGNTLIKTVPAFQSGFKTGSRFDASKITSFIQEEKHWILYSAGNTKIFEEKSGEYKLLEEIKSRVDRKHSSGGFSQGRFERKREEQIENHLEKVKEEIKELENLYILGEETVCKRLKGKYLGGFNPNRSKPGQFYRFRKLDF